MSDFARDEQVGRVLADLGKDEQVGRVLADLGKDEQVGRVLADLGSAVAGYLLPPGVEAVRATVRRRRRNRTMAAGVLAVALLVGPVAAFAAQNGDKPGPSVVGADPSVSATEPLPSSESPSAEASPSPSQSTPVGRISAERLRNSTLDIPAWPKGFTEDCATGRVMFSNGKTSGSVGELALVGQPVYVDVDADGSDETMIIVKCSPQGDDHKVLAFEPAADGSIHTFGQVLGTAGNTGKEGVDIMKVWAIEAGTGGQVRIDVGDYRPCCSTAADLPQHQWRGYGWNGQRFTQTSGPTAFGPNPKIVDFEVGVDGLALTKQADGTWRGTLTVRVRNASSYAGPAVLHFTTPDMLTVSGAEPCASGGCDHDLGTIAAGTTRTVTLTVVSVASRPSGTFKIMVTGQKDDAAYPDPDFSDNEAAAAITAG